MITSSSLTFYSRTHAYMNLVHLTTITIEIQHVGAVHRAMITVIYALDLTGMIVVRYVDSVPFYSQVELSAFWGALLGTIPIQTQLKQLILTRVYNVLRHALHAGIDYILLVNPVI